MTDEQMKKLLEEDTGEVPERFHQAILAAFGQIEDEPFDGTELPISVEAAEKPRRPRHVPRQGGRFRRMMLVMLITLGLLGGLAVATTANPRLLEVFWARILSRAHRHRRISRAIWRRWRQAATASAWKKRSMTA